MKVLWVVNTIFPDLAEALGKPVPVFGGWMYGLAQDLAATPGVELAVATASLSIPTNSKQVKGIGYYVLGAKKHNMWYDSSLEPQWQKIIAEFQPDVVHIHGTEYAHGLSLMRSCPDLKYLIAIQGILAECHKYYHAGIDKKSAILSLTFKDVIKGSGILRQKRQFKKRAEELEQEYFKRTKHIMGRSQWDKDFSLTVNPNITYHRCNDSLRNTFYTSQKWSVEKINKNQIFLSQAGYPLKGLHMLLKATTYLLEDFPDLKIKVAGPNIIDYNSLPSKLRLIGYGKYIRGLLKKYKLEKHIEFVGMLNEQQMAQELLKSHVCVSPSSIENCSNSVGEAQLLGVPVVASYVGGVPDMIRQNESGILYRFEAVEMLAQAIRKIFCDNSFAEEISKNSISSGEIRHNRSINMETTVSIYKNITKASPLTI